MNETSHSRVEDSARGTEGLRELYEQYNRNTVELRLAFERLERRFQEIDPYNIYNSITEALITLDADENILTFNRAAERIFERSHREVSGKPFRQALPMCADAFAEHVREPSLDRRHEIHFANRQGDPQVLSGRFSPLLDRHGAEIGAT